MSPRDPAALLDGLSARDLAILESIQRFRLLSTAHLRRLHFTDGHATVSAATRATGRVLARLEAHGLIARLGQRIGGERGGSSSLSWQLGSVGDRLLRALTGRKQRRRYVEPSTLFARHTLGTAECAVRLIEAARAGQFELLRLEAEPTCWRSFLTGPGVVTWLKPDLYVVTATDDFEDHTFIEVDLGTEHPPVAVRKARVYQRYRATGRHEAEHGVFPAVAWVVPDTARLTALQGALRAERDIDPSLFQVVTAASLIDVVAPGDARDPGPPAAEDTTPTHTRKEVHP